jgi:hypothetical protein
MEVEADYSELESKVLYSFNNGFDSTYIVLNIKLSYYRYYKDFNVKTELHIYIKGYRGTSPLQVEKNR